MKRPLLLGLSSLAVVSLVGAAVVAYGVRNSHAASVTFQTITLETAGSVSLPDATVGTDTTTQADEVDVALNGDADGGGGDTPDGGVNRTLPGTKTGNGRVISPDTRPKSNPVLGTHFEGLNLFNQRFANGGNQFSVEPPDQALCVGNGFVLESVNDVLRVYHTDGSPASGVVDLNSFYGYAPAIIRTGPKAGQRGPSITDPVCLYDQAIGRFVHVVLTLDHVGTTGALNGNDHLDIAVSNTGDPTGTWTIYKLPVQNNGTGGTPDHHCDRGFCLGDYPHIGADANGVFLTTNEFATLGSGFFGAQVYGIGNNVLTGGTGSVVLFNTLGAGPDGAGFTVWPAQTPGDQFDDSNGGTEYFLSSRAVFSDDGTSNSILLWTFANTSSLNTTSPSPTLDLASIPVDTYAVPPRATQPAGSRPLSQCIADTVILPNCNTKIAGIGTHNNATFGPPNGVLNANDSRFGQVDYANGKLWGAIGTAVTVGTETRAGAAFYVVNPHAANLELQGQVGLPHTDITYPTVGVLENGRGVLSFTLTGDSTFPSAAYASLDAKLGVGDVQVAAAGAGPWDGFTSYRAFATRPRWGDYGATAVDGNSIWVAAEYVAQTCTYATYIVDPTCGGTRAPLGNWSTHISNLVP